MFEKNVNFYINVQDFKSYNINYNIVLKGV